MQGHRLLLFNHSESADLDLNRLNEKEGVHNQDTVYMGNNLKINFVTLTLSEEFMV